MLFPITRLITIIKTLKSTHHATLVKPSQIDDAKHYTHHNPLERSKQAQQSVEEEQKVVHHAIQTSMR